LQIGGGIAKSERGSEFISANDSISQVAQNRLLYKPVEYVPSKAN
jgi:hypothetical protein